LPQPSVESRSAAKVICVVSTKAAENVVGPISNFLSGEASQGLLVLRIYSKA
jgi:hypothetical protein